MNDDVAVSPTVEAPAPLGVSLSVVCVCVREREIERERLRLWLCSCRTDCIVKFVVKVEFAPILTFVRGSGAKKQQHLAGCRIRSAFIC